MDFQPRKVIRTAGVWTPLADIKRKQVKLEKNITRNVSDGVSILRGNEDKQHVVDAGITCFVTESSSGQCETQHDRRAAMIAF